jgi:hypothetical protein
MRRPAFVIFCSIVVTHTLVTIAFPHVRAYDALAWETAVRALRTGGDPYAPGVLNYPPLWLQVLDGLSRLSDATGISLNTLLRILLGTLEFLTALVIYDIVRRYFPMRQVLTAVLIGLTLNPAVILLQTVHGNYDILVALWTVLFVRSMLDYAKSGDPADWLMSALFVGMGILSKVVPVVLIPLLVPGFIAAKTRTRLLGAILTFGPVLLAGSVLFSLNPEGAKRTAVYNSIAGYFGVTGILDGIGLHTASDWYASTFRLILVALLIGIAVLFARRGVPRGADLLRATVFLMLFVPVWGPGFGAQYLLWIVPPLVLLWPVATSVERRLMTVGWVIVAVTYLVEYAVVPSQGAYAFSIGDSAWLRSVQHALSTPARVTMWRLPMFVVLAALTVVSAVKVVWWDEGKSAPPERSRVPER